MDNETNLFGENKLEQELAGLAEVAEHLGVTKQVIANWRNRYANFPKPLVELKSGPVFDLNDIIYWDLNRKPNTQSISVEEWKNEWGDIAIFINDNYIIYDKMDRGGVNCISLSKENEKKTILEIKQEYYSNGFRPVITQDKKENSIEYLVTMNNDIQEIVGIRNKITGKHYKLSQIEEAALNKEFSIHDLPVEVFNKLDKETQIKLLVILNSEKSNSTPEIKIHKKLKDLDKF